MAIVDGAGRPIGITVHSASPAEVTLVDDVLQSIPGEGWPKRLLGDKAYDSDPLDQRLLRDAGIEVIAKNRSNRRVMSQDGRSARRLKRRWVVERYFAWLGNFRRLPIRWEHHVANYLGFMHLACAMILLRSF
jgi:transposase